MPIDADHTAAQSHWNGPVQRLAGLLVKPEAVADTPTMTAAETGPGGTPGARSGISITSIRPRERTAGGVVARARFW